MAVGQVDGEGDKNKLHPLFPVQAETFPEGWGKGTCLQGVKVRARPKTHCLFSMSGVTTGSVTYVLGSKRDAPPPGPAAFTDVLLQRAEFATRETLLLPENNKSEKPRTSGLRFPGSWVVFAV